MTIAFRPQSLLAVLALMPGLAAAQPIAGLYIGAGAGANFRPTNNQENALTGAAGARAAGNRPRFNLLTGIAGNAAIGWGFGNGLRVELEGSGRGNAIDNARIGSTRLTRTGNRAQAFTTTAGMVNLLYDLQALRFDIGVPVTPYIGAGLGAAVNQASRVNLSAANGTALTLRGSRTGFAYQGIVGASVGLDRLTPGLALTTEYRFLGTAEPNFAATYRPAGGATASAGNLRVPGNNHAVLLGLRYAFGAPPVAPPAAVVPQPVAAPARELARTYLVFFDWNRAELTDRAREIVAEAAAARNTVRTTRIEVAGHADRSGSPGYNQALSQRRAEAVAAELVRRGVGRGEIDIQAFGETRPLVATADGVREPQNRRVEIILR